MSVTTSFSWWILLAFVEQEVQKWKSGKPLCGCRARVPNPGQVRAWRDGKGHVGVPTK